MENMPRKTKPSKVKVLGQQYTIDWIDSGDVETTPGITKDMVLGQLSASRQWIAIRKDQGKDQLRDTLLHELLHCCYYMMKGDTGDEETIGMIAPVLLDLLRSNPQVVRFLLEEN